MLTAMNPYRGDLRVVPGVMPFEPELREFYLVILGIFELPGLEVSTLIGPRTNGDEL